MLALQTIAHSETGLVRKTNQDSGYASQRLLLVADGMGGAAAGDLASATAVRVLSAAGQGPPAVDCDEALTTTLTMPQIQSPTSDDAAPPDTQTAPPDTQTQTTLTTQTTAATPAAPAAPATGQAALDLLRQLTEQANAEIARLVWVDPDLDGMGTTVCGGIFDGANLNIVHIGDSRGYLVSDGQLCRLTHDHSYVQSLIDEGRLDERRAMSHPHRSLILKVLNGQPDIQPDFISVPVRAGDRIMFCSDGLCGLVGDSEILAVLKLWDLEHAMAALVELAHAAGGTDNITIVLAEVVETTGPTARPAGPAPDGSTAPDGSPDSVIGAAADPRIIALLEQLSQLAQTRPEPNQTDRGGARVHSQGRATDRASHSERAKVANIRLSPAALERQRYTPTPRRRRWGIWVILAAVLVALGGTGWGVYEYVTHQFYVGAADQLVAIYQGLPGSVAGIETSKVFERTTIQLADLPISLRDKVTATLPGGDLDQARSSVRELSDKSQQCLRSRAAHKPGDPPAQDGC